MDVVAAREEEGRTVCLQGLMGWFTMSSGTGCTKWQKSKYSDLPPDIKGVKTKKDVEMEGGSVNDDQG